jgi:hypothetical protein
VSINTKVTLELTAAQARIVGQHADEQIEESRKWGHFTDSEQWEEISRVAHDAADRGFAR